MSTTIDYEPTDSGIKALAAAIVMQAAEDYGNALLGNPIINYPMSYYRKTPGVLSYPLRIAEECESFFRSEWFELLNPLRMTGETAIREIRKQVEYWPRKRRFILISGDNHNKGGCQ